MIGNALTVDLEDWAQAVLGPDTPLTDRFIANTRRVLALFREQDVRATFFALGKVVERCPDLIREIRDEGHEIGSHGYGHELLFTIDPDRFRADVQRSIDLIERVVGHRPIGYRAPGFSIVRQTLWAGPILAELGFQYSSSIFPFAGRRYGIPGSPRGPYRWPDCDLWELPLPVAKIAGRYRPAAGGGYTRLLPLPVLRHLLGRVNRAGLPAVLYLHPHELDPQEIRALRKQGWPIGRKVGFTQSLFRSRVADRLRGLLSHFQFGPAADVLGLTYPPAGRHDNRRPAPEPRCPVGVATP